MTTQEMVQEIVKYFENSSLFRPHLTPQGFSTPTQLEGALKIDISNGIPTSLDDSKTYELESVEQAYEIISGVYATPKGEIQPEVDSFLQENGVDSAKPLYLTAFLVELTNQDEQKRRML
ncbi:MAG: hypothetical protein H7Y42_14000 [Chitinophagaceae bacterium]|nr:hypothetical protein [Chitinophagaceae bacterium]